VHFKQSLGLTIKHKQQNLFHFFKNSFNANSKRVSEVRKREPANAWSSFLIEIQFLFLLVGYKTSRSLEKNKPQQSLPCINWILNSDWLALTRNRRLAKAWSSVPFLSELLAISDFLLLPVLGTDRTERRACQLCFWELHPPTTTLLSWAELHISMETVGV